MGKLIAIRHGQSIWNAENRFTGWVNVVLSENRNTIFKTSNTLVRGVGLTNGVGFGRS